MNRTFFARFLILLLCIFFASFPSTVLHAQNTGSISGKVISDTNASGIPNFSVSLIGSNRLWLVSTYTDSLGQFSFFDLAPGQYYLSTDNGDYIGEYYSDAADINSATPIKVDNGSAITGISISLAPGGSISGRLTISDTGSPANSVYINVYDSLWNAIGSSQTDSNGNYRIGGLKSGLYFVEANSSETIEYYIDSFEHATATAVPVVSGKETSNINFSIAAGLTAIAGKVARDPDGAGIPNLPIEVAIIFYDGSVFNLDPVVTDSSGYYRIPASYNYNYRIHALGGDGYESKYYNNVQSSNDATLIRPTANKDTIVNFSLKQYGSISGKITRSSDGSAVANAKLTFFGLDGSAFASTTADANGNYIKKQLYAGTLYLKAEDPANAALFTYYGNSATLSGASSLTITSGLNITNADIALIPPSVGIISGRITSNDDGSGVPNATIRVYNITTLLAISVSSDASGFYSAKGLEPGKYRIEVYADNLTPEIYNNIRNWGYDYSISDLSYSLATLIEVKAGTEIANINFALSRFAAIGGSVRSTDGVSLLGVYVTLYDSSWNFISWVKTDSSGGYKFENLSPGSYYLYADPSQFAPNYAAAYYSNATDRNSATPVSIASGETKQGIDFGLSSGGSISGKVTRASDGAPLANIVVYAYDAQGAYVRSAKTDASGSYTITSLSGAFRIGAEPSQIYVRTYYSNTTKLSDAATVTVALGSDRTNINISMALGGSISGKIVCASANSLFPQVTAYDLSWNYVGYVYGLVNSNPPSYTVPGLPPGSYYLYADLGSKCGTKYYDNSDSKSDAKPVSVIVGQDTGNIDFNVNSTFSISGTVTSNADSSAIANVDIIVFNSAWNQIASMQTSASGAYTISGITPGAYYIKTSNTFGYIDAYYNNAVNKSDASALQIVQGKDATNINFSLKPYPSIHGKITRQSDGVGVQGVSVIAYGSNWSAVSSAVSDAAGNYIIQRIAPGSYYLMATISLGYKDNYYNNADAKSAAQAITVLLDADVYNINFALTSGANIFGKVFRNSDGTGISHTQISVFGSDGTIATTAIADASGNYQIPGLSAGSYRLQASAGAGYISKYYKNASSLSAATAIALSNGTNLDTIDVGLTAINSITGKVTKDKDGAPIVGVEIQAFADFSKETRDKAYKSKTNDNGEYYLEGLTPGKYYLVTSNNLGFVDEYYDNASEAGAMPVEVFAGAETPNVNFGLSNGGSISGQISGDYPFQNCVYQAAVNIFNESWDLVKSAVSDIDGNYAVTGLGAGNYYVQASSDYNVATYYTNSWSRAGATSIKVEPEKEDENINLLLAYLGSISGWIIRSSDGQGLSDITVNAYNMAGELIKSSQSTAYGFYSIDGLIPGNYYIATSNAPGYVDKYYVDATSKENATVVVMTGEGITRNQSVNLYLGEGGSISGRVTNASNGSAISDKEVRAYSGDKVVKSAITDSNGYYILTGIEPGIYQVRPYPVSGQIVNQQNPVTVSNNSEIRDIDFQLEYGLAITGVVARATDGMGILGIKVLAYNANLELVGTGITDAGGAYVIPQLVPGNYFLQTQNTFGFKDKFCENAKTQETATKVNLNEGIRTINFTLESTLDDFYDQMLDDMNKD